MLAGFSPANWNWFLSSWTSGHLPMTLFSNGTKGELTLPLPGGSSNVRETDGKRSPLLGFSFSYSYLGLPSGGESYLLLLPPATFSHLFSWSLSCLTSSSAPLVSSFFSIPHYCEQGPLLLLQPALVFQSYRVTQWTLPSIHPTRLAGRWTVLSDFHNWI